MEIPTYDEILTALLDEYDRRIAPETIERNDGNIIYKFATAIAKTFERTNSLLDATQSPFDPLTCTEEQLASLESITQIRRIQGKASGLEVLIRNTSVSETATLPSGTYRYQSGDAYFSLTLSEPLVIQHSSSVSRTFISRDADGELLLGEYPVTEQETIAVSAEGAAIPDAVVFSCYGNQGLLGRSEETDAEYRERIASVSKKQNEIDWMVSEISALPYVFDCQLLLNNTATAKPVSADYSIQPYHMGVFVEGEFTEEIADIIYSNTLYLTDKTNDDAVRYSFANPALSSGGIDIWVNPFQRLWYKVEIIWKSSSSLIDSEKIQDSISEAVMSKMNRHVHKDYITENEIYGIALSLNIEGVSVLNVTLLDDSTGLEVQDGYISVRPSEIALIREVQFVQK